MNLLSKIGQMFVIGLEGPQLTSKESEFIIEHDIGGIILFDRNIQNPEQILHLTTEIQALSAHTESKLPFFISIDMEGGRVQRLKEPFTIWPPMRYLGWSESPSLAFNFSQAMGAELSAVGINLNYTPCIDVLKHPENQVIGDRSLSSDPEIVGKMASGIIRGFKKSGILTCAKHFPGHGATCIDSHEDLPKDDRTWEELLNSEVIPYKKVFRSKVEFVMTAHILFKNIDPKNPVTLSSQFISQYLKEELRCQALVITDDLDMKALSQTQSPDELTYQAFLAGVDIFLFCNQPESHILAIKSLKKRAHELSPERLESSFKKIQDTKEKLSAQWQPSELHLVGCPEHKDLAQQILSFNGSTTQ